MATMNLELQLKLQDRMSAGMKAALKAMQDGSKNARREMDGLANAANRIKPTGIERMAKALREVKTLSKSVMDTLNKTAQAGAAIGAGAYVAKRALDKPMAYDKNLALASNVAYTPVQRAAGRVAMNKTVQAAVISGNGTQEDTLGVLKELYGSGAFTNEEADKLLPKIMKTAYGNNADPMHLVQMAVSAKQSGKLKNEEIPLMFSKLINSTNSGGFELKDFAASFSEQMAKYAANGMTGMRMIDDLAAYNQAVKIASGSSAETGVNMVNFLNKISAPDTKKDFQKHGIDLTKELALGASRGESTFDIVLAQVDKVVGKDKNYQMLVEKLKTAKDGEAQQIGEQMKAVFEMAGIGSLYQDSQAMTGVLGARQNKAKLNEIRNKVRADDGSNIEANYQNVRGTVSGEAEASTNRINTAAYNAEQAVSGPLKFILSGMNGLAEAFPTLAASSYAAATALGMVAASAGMGAILNGGKGKAIVTAAKTVVSGTVARVGLGAAGATAAAAAAPFAMPIAALGATGFLAYAAATKMGAGDLLDNTKLGEGIGQAIAIALAAFGNKEAKEALQINLHLDGKQISSTVQTRQTKEARRH